MRALATVGPRDRAWVPAATQQRAKELHCFRTAAAQLLGAVQAYICAQLHSASLPALLQDIKVCQPFMHQDMATVKRRRCNAAMWNEC